MGFGNIVSDALNIMRDEKKFYKDYLPQEAITVGNRCGFLPFQFEWIDSADTATAVHDKRISQSTALN